jgi:phytochelatin synthase
MASFYRRPLPATLLALDSPEGRRLFAEALAAGHLESYFPLAEQFQTQAEPSFCGLTSLVVVLNSLAVDPGRLWKGPWRWFGEEMLDCCVPLDEVRVRGLTLDELACLARCNGARATAHRPTDGPGSLDALRAAVVASATDRTAPRVVVSYGRTALEQTGEGHFSPVAGYHPGRDLALVLDVARFKYPPHWVSVASLHEATATIDPATGRSRGWVLLAAGRRPTALGMALRCDGLSRETIAALLERARLALASAAPTDLVSAAAVYFAVVAPLAAALGQRELGDDALREQATALRAELAASAAADVASAARAGLVGLDPGSTPPADAPAPPPARDSQADAAIAALLLLIAPAQVREAVPALAEAWADLRQPLSSALREELATLDAQLAYITSEPASLRAAE